MSFTPAAVTEEVDAAAMVAAQNEWRPREGVDEIRSSDALQAKVRASANNLGGNHGRGMKHSSTG